MCKVGDIINVEMYKSNGTNVTRHSFIVLSDEKGVIKGVDYDFIALVLSSFKSEEQKNRKLSYPGNLEIKFEETQINDGGNGKDGYVKCEQFYFFNKEKISFEVIGTLKENVYDKIIEYINDLISKGVVFEQIVDNL